MRLSIYQQFQKTAKSNKDKPFIIEEDNVLTFEETSKLIDKFSYYLESKIGLKRGDRIAFLLNNQLEFVIALLSSNKLGLIVTPLNNRLTSEEIEYMVNASAAKAIVFNSIYQEKISKIKEALKIDAKIIKGLDIIGETKTCIQEDAFILFTSGTTGIPKGVLHTNKNSLFYANVMIEGLGFRPDMKHLIAAPLYHAIGCEDQLIPAIILGQTVVLTNNTTPQNIAYLLERHSIDILLGPPSIFTLLILSGMAKRYRLLGTNVFGYAGAPMRPQVIKMLKKAFPHIKLFNFYGSTEVGGTITILDDGYALSHAETVGKAVKGVEVRVLDKDEFVLDKIGEVVTRPNYMKGYVNADTEGVFFDGYLRMGDLGKLDKQGFLTLFGRIGDMMIVQGENVYPIEIERVLIESGLLKEACVIGRDTILGQQPVAFVSPIEEDKERVIEKLKAICKEKLADFKRPRDFIVLKEIPKNPVGKIDKRKLLELLNKK